MDTKERMNQMAGIVDMPTLIWFCLCGLFIAAYLFSLKGYAD